MDRVWAQAPDEVRQSIYKAHAIVAVAAVAVASEPPAPADDLHDALKVAAEFLADALEQLVVPTGLGAVNGQPSHSPPDSGARNNWMY